MANGKRYKIFGIVAAITISVGAYAYGTGYGTSTQINTASNSIAYRVGIGVREKALADLISSMVVEKLKAQGVNVGVADATSRAQVVVDAYCAQCHNGDEERLELSDLTVLTDAQKLDVLRQVASGNMPKNAAPLSNESKDVLLNYLLEKGN